MQGSKRLLISFQFAGLDLQGGRQQSGGRYVAPHLRNKVASKYKFPPGTSWVSICLLNCFGRPSEYGGIIHATFSVSTGMVVKSV